MRTDLKVPFAEKDEAKKLGARWDAARKIWYVLNVADLAPFSRWMPAGVLQGKAPGAAAPTAAGPRKSSAGVLVVGSRYVEQASVCDCVPWEICDKCRPLALSS